MRRFLLCLIMSALFFGQGFSVAAAICRHGGQAEHVAARSSTDGAVASAARSEETAAAVAGKQGALADAGSAHSAVADLPAPVRLKDRNAAVSSTPWPLAEPLALDDEAAKPLLRPPTA